MLLWVLFLADVLGSSVVYVSKQRPLFHLPDETGLCSVDFQNSSVTCTLYPTGMSKEVSFSKLMSRVTGSALIGTLLPKRDVVIVEDEGSQVAIDDALDMEVFKSGSLRSLLFEKLGHPDDVRAAELILAYRLLSIDKSKLWSILKVYISDFKVVRIAIDELKVTNLSKGEKQYAVNVGAYATCFGGVGTFFFGETCYFKDHFQRGISYFGHANFKSENVFLFDLSGGVEFFLAVVSDALNIWRALPSKAVELGSTYLPLSAHKKLNRLYEKLFGDESLSKIAQIQPGVLISNFIKFRAGRILHPLAQSSFYNGSRFIFLDINETFTDKELTEFKLQSEEHSYKQCHGNSIWSQTLSLWFCVSAINRFLYASEKSTEHFDIQGCSKWTNPFCLFTGISNFESPLLAFFVYKNQPTDWLLRPHGRPVDSTDVAVAISFPAESRNKSKTADIFFERHNALMHAINT